MKPAADPNALALHRRQTELVKRSLLCVGRLPGERARAGERDPHRAANARQSLDPFERVWQRAA